MCTAGRRSETASVELLTIFLLRKSYRLHGV
jgi:hypothetical protein